MKSLQRETGHHIDGLMSLLQKTETRRMLFKSSIGPCPSGGALRWLGTTATSSTRYESRPARSSPHLAPTYPCRRRLAHRSVDIENIGIPHTTPQPEKFLHQTMAGCMLSPISLRFLGQNLFTESDYLYMSRSNPPPQEERKRSQSVIMLLGCIRLTSCHSSHDHQACHVLLLLVAVCIWLQRVPFCHACHRNICKNM